MAKKDFQKEVGKLMDQMKVHFEKFSKDASVFAKKSEKEIVKASKIGRLQVDIVGMNMQKEKIYYELGKKIIAQRSKKGVEIDKICSPFFQKYRKLETFPLG